MPSPPKRFDELNANATLDDADLFAVYDVSIPETQRITVAALRAAITGAIPDTTLQEAYDAGETVQIVTGTPILVEDISGAGYLISLADINGSGMSLTAAGLRSAGQMAHYPESHATATSAGYNHTLLGGEGGAGTGVAASGNGGNVVIDAGPPGLDGGAGQGTGGAVNIGVTNAESIASGSGLTVWSHAGEVHVSSIVRGGQLHLNEGLTPGATAGRAKLVASNVDNKLGVVLSTGDVWTLAGASGITPPSAGATGAEGTNLTHARSDHRHPFERMLVVVNTLDTTDTLADTDHNTIISVQNAGGMVVTVPTGLTPGTYAQYLQSQGTGAVTVVAGGGMTLIVPPSGAAQTYEEGTAISIRILLTNVALVEYVRPPAFAYVYDRSVSSDVTISNTTDEIVRVDASGGNRTLTLPDPAGGRKFMIKKTSTGTNTVSLAQNAGEQIEGVAATHLLAGSAGTGRPAWMVWSDGTNWWVA